MLRVLLVTHGELSIKKMGYIVRVNNLIHCLKQRDDVYLKIIEYPNLMVAEGKQVPQEDTIRLNAPRNWFVFGPKLIFDSILKMPFIKKFDIIVIEGSVFFPYAFIGRILGKKVVYDSHAFISMISRKTAGISNFIKRRIIGESLDWLAVKTSHYTITVSNYDLEYAKNYFKIKPNKIFTIPNSVEIKACHPVNNVGKYWLFVGDMTFEPNYLAVLEIFKIAERLRNERFVIVGRGNERFLHHPSNVDFTGMVDSLDELYMNAKGCLIPLFIGAGIKLRS
ncbi:glycosyltransferase [Sulfuracidifex tepidarius]|uniref:glycosyltransferase n=1 Tax=Sulfuracidifex tepidarius TaxID=1294262 RepID=UPI0006D174FB|nr:glycosyltransferase [Sulfuracidifex tepidarius]